MDTSTIFNFIQGSNITGESSYDIYKSIYTDATPNDFLEYLKGKSAYEIWLELEGNEGKTEEEFINSLGVSEDKLNLESEARIAGDEQTLTDAKTYTDSAIELRIEEVRNISSSTIYQKPTSIAIQSGMQIIFYASSAGTMNITIGENIWSNYLSSSNAVVWALWLQTTDIDGSLILPSGTRNYFITNEVITETAVSWEPETEQTNPNWIVITIK